LFTWSVVGRATAEVAVLRGNGPSFMRLPDGRIASQVRLKIENETAEPRRYVVSLTGAPDAVLRSPLAVWQVKPHHAQEIPLFVEVEATSFARGERRVGLRVDDDQGFERIVTITLLGPADTGAPDRAPERDMQ
jgi:polyferredoxin